MFVNCGCSSTIRKVFPFPLSLKHFLLTQQERTTMNGINSTKFMKSEKITKRAFQVVAVFVHIMVSLTFPIHRMNVERRTMRVGWAKLPSIMKWRQLLYNVIYTVLPSHAIIIIHRAIQSVWFSCCFYSASRSAVPFTRPYRNQRTNEEMKRRKFS